MMVHTKETYQIDIHAKSLGSEKKNDFAKKRNRHEDAIITQT